MMLLNLNKNLRTKHMEILSLLLVLSFIIFHNIYIVFFGLVLAILLINKEFIFNVVRLNELRESNEEKTNRNISKEIENLSPNDDKEDNLISLVEAIEESGYIPSLEKDDTSKAA